VFSIPEFKPNEAKAKEIQNSVNKAASKEEEEKEVAAEEEPVPDQDDTQKAKDEFLHIYNNLTIQKKK
jgi:hypothetical protein